MPRKNAVVLALDGVLESPESLGVPEIVAAFATGKSCVVLDFERVTAIQSAGISSLIECHALAKGAEAQLMLANVPINLANLLRLSGVSREIISFASVDSILRAHGAEGVPESRE